MYSLQFSLASRYLGGRKLRTFLTTLAVMFGTLVIFCMNIILPTMMAAFQTNLKAAAGQVDLTISLQSGEAFSRKEINKLRSIPDIQAISGSLSRTVNIPTGYYDDEGVTALTLTGIDPKTAPLLRRYPIEQGRFLRSDDDHVAVITTSLAGSLGVKVGERFSLPTTEGSADLKVVGLLPARAMPGNEEVLVSLYEAQKLFDVPERINTIDINLTTLDTAERDAIWAEVQRILGPDYVLGGLGSGTELFASLKTGQAAFNLFGFLSLFMGGFIIFNTFRTIVAERRHDIGMLRSIGANRGTIIGMILAEGLLQGVVGSLAGMVVGYWMGAGILKLMAPMLSSFMHVEMGAPVVTPGLIIGTLALGIGVTLLAGLLPAFTAGRVTPLEALRPTAVEGSRLTLGIGFFSGALLILLSVLALMSGAMAFTALGGLMFLIGLVLVAPAVVKPVSVVFGALLGVLFARQGTSDLAQGNLTRQPSRAAITASATMIGLAIIVGMGGMVWSITGGFLGVLERSLGSDYLIMPPSVAVWGSNVGARSDMAERLRDIPGVKVVSTMRFAAATANGKAVSLLGIDPQDYPQVSSLTFTEGDPASAYAALDAGRAIIANGVFAAQGMFKVGDLVRVSTPTGPKEYRLVAIAGDYLNAKVVTAYISQESMLKDFRKSEDVFIQLNLEDEADPALVEARMQGILENYPQFKLISGQSYINENRQLFSSVFAFYFVLLGVLATPSLIALLNTLAIGVIERTREIGMLRAIGASQKQVRRTVIAEALLLAALGTALGLLAGLYLGYVMLLGLKTGGFPVEYVFPYGGLIAATAAGLIFGVLAALFPARQAARMDIVRALRYE